jgi:C-terminal processing protease CtpA/Prc
MGSLMHGHKTTASDADAAAAATKVQAVMRGKSVRSALEKKQPAQDEPAPKEVETAAHRLTSWMGSLMHGHKTTASDADAAAAATQVQAVMRGKSVRSAREKKQPAQATHSYEPTPDEILTVRLHKPTADTKLGITLMGTGRPYIKSLIADGLTAMAGLQEHDVFLKVNGQPAVGHEKTAAQLRTATGEIIIEFYRVLITTSPR